MYVCVIGSLRNPAIPLIANRLRKIGCEVFDDWFAAGRRADDEWRDYERLRGRTYREALSGLAAQHVFRFDERHLNMADVGLLIMPCGKSGWIELGYLKGRGRLTGILIEQDPKRWDVMACFADRIFSSVEEIETWLQSGAEGNFSRPSQGC